jgi:hypothetical protein
MTETKEGKLTKTCFAKNCNLTIDSGVLMCRTHWYEVPKAIRDLVYRTYNRGRGVGTPEHTEAILAARKSLL